MPHITTDDAVQIYYEEHGAGPALVLAYGVGGNTDQWDTNIAQLSKRHRLILWEPRGHARSDSPADPARYSFQRWVLDLRDLLDRIGLPRAFVGGHSLGGGIATRFALQFPERVRALVVTNSSSAAGTPMSVKAFMMWARTVEVAEQGIEAVAEYQMQHNPNLVEFLTLYPAQRADILERFRSNTAVGFQNSVRAMMGMEPFVHELDKLVVPTLLLAGDRDPSLKPLQALHARVASELLVLAPATHFANREQPDAWNDAVTRFLERHQA